MNQLIEILRRARTTEMAKLKFSTNFGVSVNTIEYFTQKLYIVPLDEIQSFMGEIDNTQLLNIYVYISFCDDLLRGNKIYKDKKKISRLILKQFFDRKPELVKQFQDAAHHIDSSDDDNITQGGGKQSGGNNTQDFENRKLGKLQKEFQ